MINVLAVGAKNFLQSREVSFRNAPYVHKDWKSSNGLSVETVSRVGGGRWEGRLFKKLLLLII